MESESSTDAMNTLKQSEAQFGMSLLASTLAHEIRNPLQTIRLLLDAASRGGSTLNTIHKISENITRLESVVNRVEQLTQRYVIHPQTLNLKQLVESALSSLQFWLGAAGINVRIHSQWEGEPLVTGDSELLQQVLLNLVMNSVQAMPKGGTLTLNVYEAVDNASIEVIDSGVGISPESLKLVGTPFFTTKPNGQGLGLAFCKTIAALHGGSLEVESKLGSGTKITLHILKNVTPKEDSYNA